MAKNPMFNNLPTVDEAELIKKLKISQENYERYRELKAVPITIILQNGRGRPHYCRPDGYIEGFACAGACKLFLEATRGNRRRLMPEMVRRSGLAESTIYKILTYEPMNEDVIQEFEWALNDMLNAPDFDLPTEEPDLGNLSEWLQRWVGSFDWIANFVGVKSNTLIAGLRRSTDWKERCLEFAQRWYSARCGQYRRVSQDDLVKRYVHYLEFREEKAAMLLGKAESTAEELSRRDIQEWEKTQAGQLYLEDVSSVGEDMALRRSCERAKPHPSLTGGSQAYLRSGLFRAVRDYQDIGESPKHLHEPPLDLLIVHPPGEAEDLWPKA
jgi:hypothetical protein